MIENNFSKFVKNYKNHDKTDYKTNTKPNYIKV